MGGEVDERVVETHPSGAIAHDRVNHVDKMQGAVWGEARLLSELAQSGFNHRLAELLPAAGQRPLASPRWGAAAYQEHGGAAEQDDAHPDARMRRIFPLVQEGSLGCGAATSSGR